MATSGIGQIVVLDEAGAETMRDMIAKQDRLIAQQRARNRLARTSRTGAADGEAQAETAIENERKGAEMGGNTKGGGGITQFDARNITMMMDLYELTMANAYLLEEGETDTQVAFDVFYRRNPDGGGYAVFAGLEQVLEYLEGMRFDEEDIEYLRGLGLFDGRGRHRCVRPQAAGRGSVICCSPILRYFVYTIYCSIHCCLCEEIR